VFGFIGSKDRLIEAIRSHEPPPYVHDRAAWERLKQFVIDSIGQVKSLEGDLHGVSSQWEAGVSVQYLLEDDGSVTVEVVPARLRI